MLKIVPIGENLDGIPLEEKPHPVLLYSAERNLLLSLLSYLKKNNMTFDEGRLILDELRIKTNGRVHLASDEHVIISSGRDFNKEQRRINGIHLNPNLTERGDFKSPHIPFKSLRIRPKVKRPKRC